LDIRALSVPCLAALLGFYSCGNDTTTGQEDVPAETDRYAVFAWNDLGMQALNPSYDQAVLLPPGNTLRAQVIRKGDPPSLVTHGISVRYRVDGNTYSSGKRQYGGFWDHARRLLGFDLAPDTGLHGSPGNGLAGEMAISGNCFEASGIPVTPVDDAGVWNPCQTAEITVLDENGATLVQTRTTIPVSDAMNCANCHGGDPFRDVLVRHDSLHGTALVPDAPVLCASCHPVPTLGTGGKDSALSEAMHRAHASRGAACMDCHPGPVPAFNRSLAHGAGDGNCAACHDTGENIPGADEASCASCHQGVPEVDTGAIRYRDAAGHGGMRCAACHGSPHAMIPSVEPSDNYTAIQYQGREVPIGSCRACHAGSRVGGDLAAFGAGHVGNPPNAVTSCNICHTSVTAEAAGWPHGFGWKDR
jgi:hypothetical protein